MSVYDFMYYYRLVKSNENELRGLMDCKRVVNVFDNTTRKKLFKEMVILHYPHKGDNGGIDSYPSCLTRMILNGLIDDIVYEKYLCMVDESSNYKYSEIEN